jgi:hypothetical protein
LTLTPSNQIIHPGNIHLILEIGRYYGIFSEWDGKKVYEKKDIPLLYEGMDDISAKYMQDLNDELQLIKNTLEKKYKNLDLSFVKDLGKRIIEGIYFITLRLWR